jgi:nitrite reductase (NADH) large subunit
VAAKHVIVGNSVAAVGAIEAIRSLDGEADITVVSRERYSVYSRPLISYYLGGKVTEPKMAYRPKNFYTTNRVETLLGVEAVGLEPLEHTLALAGKKKPLSYDKLLLATGGVPFCPPIEGRDRKDVYTFTTLDDAKALSTALKRLEHVVVIGGGLIGLKVTEGLVQRGVEVTVVELADRILSPALDKVASKMVADHLAKKGVTILTGDTVTAITGPDMSVEGMRLKKGAVEGVRLKSGRELACDAVVVAIGVVPNVGWLRGSGLKIERGILVDGHMRTSKKDVYAAGDVTEAPEMLGPGRRVVPIWPDAYRQGFVAGSNMGGRRTPYEGGLPMNSLDLLGISLVSVGLANVDDGQYTVERAVDPVSRAYRRLVFQGDYLVGALLVRDIDRAGLFTGLIRDHVNIKDFRRRMMADEFGLLVLPDSYREMTLSGKGAA